MEKVTKDMIIGQLIGIDSGIIPILTQAGMHCIGCPGAQMESLEEAGEIHGIDVDKLVSDINDYLSVKQ